MALITLTEIIYLLITTLVIGYIFTGIVKIHKRGISTKRFDLEDFKQGVYVAAPGIILHELSHKFVAMAFGLMAKFQIFTFGLVLGAILKFINSPFILLAPGYVGIEGNPAQSVMVLVAFAGPAVNLILWISSHYILKYKNLRRKHAIFVFLTKEINKWLFIFNMLPIPPLDGSKVWFGLFRFLF